MGCALFVRLCHDPLFGGDRSAVVKLNDFGCLVFSARRRPLGDGASVKRPLFQGVGPFRVAATSPWTACSAWLVVVVNGAVFGGGVSGQWLRMSFTDPS